MSANYEQEFNKFIVIYLKSILKDIIINTYSIQLKPGEASLLPSQSKLDSCNQNECSLALCSRSQIQILDCTGVKFVIAYTTLNAFCILMEFSFVFSESVSAAVFSSTFKLSISFMISDGRSICATLIVLASERYPVTFLRVCTV